MLLDPTKEEEDDNATEYSKADSAWLNETDDASQMSLDSTRNNEKKKSKKKDKSKDKIKKNEENGSTIPRNPNKNILHNKIINIDFEPASSHPSHWIGSTLRIKNNNIQ